MDFNDYNWHIYSQSEEGKKAISMFTFDDYLPIHDIITTYGKRKDFMSKEECESFAQTEWDLHISLFPEPKTKEEAYRLFTMYSDCGRDTNYYQDIMLCDVVSLLFYFKSKEYFIPNLFAQNFALLYGFCDLYDITLPAIPKKADMRSRVLYYLKLNDLFQEKRKEWNLTPEEFCALLYDYTPKMLAKNRSELPAPSKAWLIGGHKLDFEKEHDYLFWQSNANVMRGDILVFYESAPISAITEIWRADHNGVTDPFFYYYSYSYLTERTEIPPITLKMLKEDDYFKNISFVKRNMQGTSARLYADDYKHLLRLIEAQGGVISSLPSIYIPQAAKAVEIKSEKDVEEEILIPFLSSCDITNTEYIRQLDLKFGHKIHKFPDFAIHYKEVGGEKTAKVIIEVKKLLKTPADFNEAFPQGRSYAMQTDAHTLMLCDQYDLYVYDRPFNRNRFRQYSWVELNSNPDKFDEIKTLLNK